jgi:maleate isomerase
MTAPPGPPGQLGIGVIVPYDMALDRELWRWAPDDVTLLFTRTPYAGLPVTVEMAAAVSDSAVVRSCTRDLSTVSPAAYAYGCTSGSFVGGLAGERALVAAMQAAGAPRAVTASGALLAALSQLNATRVAIATPYDVEVTDRLASFLGEAGVTVVSSAHLGLHADIWTIPYVRTGELIQKADHPDAEAVVVSCTNLPTYDLIAPLEDRLGKPIITANQATMWAALRSIDRRAQGPGQWLLDPRLAMR